MPTDSVTCPYCNALVPVAPGAASGQRAACPRCGETFALRLPAGTAVTDRPARSPGDGMTASPAPAVVPADGARRPFRSNVAVAALVLGVMGATAAAGLIFALHTEKDRRAHDKALPRKSRRPALEEELPSQPEEGAPVAPDRLAALGYLPPKTDVLAGVHLAELLRGPAGPALLDEPIKVGTSEVRLADLAHWTGLRPDEVDHLAVGLQADAPPSALLVVRTRGPYDPTSVRAALRAGQRLPGNPGGRTFYPFTVQPWNVPAVLWCADDRTLVVGLLRNYLEQARRPPDEGPEQLPAALRGVLREHIGAAAPVWAAGHVEDWEKTALPLVLERLRPEDRDRLLRVDAFAGWLEPGERLTATAALRGKSEADARALEEAFRGAEGEGGAEATREGAWVTVRWRGDFDALRRLLQR